MLGTDSNVSLYLYVSECGKGRRQAILGEHPSSYTDNGYGKIKTKGTQCVVLFNVLTLSAVLSSETRHVSINTPETGLQGVQRMP